MEYKEVPTAEKGCPHPLNRTAATDRIAFCILRYEFSRSLQNCLLLSKYLDKADVCVFFFVIVFFRDNSPD